MATISAPGLGSGLDVGRIVDALLEVERRPLDRLNASRTERQAELSAYGQLRSALSTFEDALDALASFSSFRVFSTTASDDTVVTASASSDAAEGGSEIVVSALAQRHKLASAAFTDANTVVGTGTLTLSVGANTFDIVIDGSNNSLAGIRDAINNSTQNTGVTATVVNADGGSHLVLTADESGTANAIQVTVADDDGNNADTNGLSRLVYQTAGTQNLNQIDAALDASFTVDGFAVTSSSNTVADVLQGVTFELRSLGTSTIQVGRDNEAVQASVQEFVDAYNALNTTVSQLRNGELRGDSALLSIESQLRTVFNTGTTGLSGLYSTLSEIGVSFNNEGVLTLDTNQLNDTLIADFRGVSNLFADATQGYVTRLRSVADELTQNNGLIDAREEGINSRIADIQRRSDAFELRLEIIERRLVNQFAALDQLLGSLNSTSSFLAAQLATLPTVRTNR